MGEKLRLFLILFIPFAVLLAGLAELAFPGFSPGFFVRNFRLDLALNENNMTAKENLDYSVTEGGFHELYRSYRLDEITREMEIIRYECPSGARFYSAVNGDYFELVCRNDAGYSPGDYRISFTYSIPSPYYCDAEQCVLHWNVMDNFGSAVNSIKVNVNGQVNEFLSVPAVMDSDDGLFTLGKLYPGGLLELFITTPLKSGIAEGISSLAPYIQEYRRSTAGFRFFSLYGKALVFGLLGLETAIILFIFFRIAKEHDVPGAPEVLHYAPKKRKPYEVDYFFGTRPGGSLDPKAVDATLLDLLRRGHLKIDGARVTVLAGRDELSEYEQKIVEFYRTYPDVNGLKARMKSMGAGEISRLSLVLERLSSPTAGMKVFFSTLFTSVASNLFWAVGGAFTLVSVILFSNFSVAAPYLLAFPVSQASLLVFKFVLDDYVFGKYTREGIKEKLEWDAFRNLLSNYALMKKYASKDISMWGEWLVFATLFGSADKVLKQMGELRIKLPYLPARDNSWFYYSGLRSYARTQLAAKASRSAGGFHGGIGGGFGGGGGGAR
jgi:uncharacterized membrane protein